MGKIIVVASGKGGTGKTTTVGAVSSCLAALGHKTLCLDCDAGLRNLDIIIGMADYAVTDFHDVLSGYISLEDACFEHPKIPGLFFLPAPAFRGPDDIDPKAMSVLLASVKERFDYCLIDSPAGIGSGFRLAASDADAALVVTVGDMTSIRDGQRVVDELISMGIDEVRLIVNRINVKLLRKLGTTVDDIIDTIGVRLLGIVEEDNEVYIASNTEMPLILHENKKAARQFLDISRRITGERLPLSGRLSR